jgi:hypothetical protein
LIEREHDERRRDARRLSPHRKEVRLGDREKEEEGRRGSEELHFIYFPHLIMIILLSGTGTKT